VIDVARAAAARRPAVASRAEGAPPRISRRVGVADSRLELPAY